MRAVAAILLCAVGFLLARAPLFRETTVVVDAGGCRLVTDVVDAGEDDAQGYVILFHGLAANKKIMSFIARGFALQGLRVFVPDLPGHGRTQGPFSFERAESCGDSFVKQMIGRGAVEAKRLVLAGHSMGGAIAIKVAARVPVAGVIAISPAPMVTTYGDREVDADFFESAADSAAHAGSEWVAGTAQHPRLCSVAAVGRECGAADNTK